MGAVSFLAALPLLVAPPQAAAAAPPGGAKVETRAIAGEGGDFVAATHVRIEGSQREIGRALAALAAERHGWKPAPATDRDALRAQREYFAARSPLALERMRGVADELGVQLDADAFPLAELGIVPSAPGCTVAYYPPATTESGAGVLSRNFDFTTGTFDGGLPPSGGGPACATPYVLELRPDAGYATLCVVAFDLLGVVDGINSEGLTIALLADDEVSDRAPRSPGPLPGFDVLQIGRHVLETCADVEEAERALRAARLYSSAIPCHYVVADRHGRSFVWENEVDLSRGHVIAGDGRPQISTNYMQHLHPDEGALPDDADELGLFGRQCTLRARIEGRGKLSLEEIRANAAHVAATRPAPPGLPPNRTLWHSLYFPGERRLEVDFYLGEGRAPGEPRIRRSSPLSFTLARP